MKLWYKLRRMMEWIQDYIETTRCYDFMEQRGKASFGLCDGGMDGCETCKYNFWNMKLYQKDSFRKEANMK